MKQIFGNRLQRARRRARVTQTNLGRILGVSRYTIARWEAGQGDPSAVEVFRCGELLHVSARWLLGQKDDLDRPDWPKADERELLALYRRLSDDGKKALLETAKEAEETFRALGEPSKPSPCDPS